MKLSVNHIQFLNTLLFLYARKKKKKKNQLSSKSDLVYTTQIKTYP